MLVPGDIIRLDAGDMVPADLRILSAKDLFLNQAALNGESLPVEKKAAPASAASGNYQSAKIKEFTRPVGAGPGFVDRQGTALENIY
jgi:P-type E1-E2 ATPase